MYIMYLYMHIGDVRGVVEMFQLGVVELCGRGGVEAFQLGGVCWRVLFVVCQQRGFEGCRLWCRVVPAGHVEGCRGVAFDLCLRVRVVCLPVWAAAT